MQLCPDFVDRHIYFHIWLRNRTITVGMFPKIKTCIIKGAPCILAIPLTFGMYTVNLCLLKIKITKHYYKYIFQLLKFYFKAKHLKWRVSICWFKWCVCTCVLRQVGYAPGRPSHVIETDILSYIAYLSLINNVRWVIYLPHYQ